MSETGKSTESVSAVHVSEDDWLRLLQQLPSSSIDTLQQTLKRLGQQDAQSNEKGNIQAAALGTCDSVSVITNTITTTSETTAPSISDTKSSIPSTVSLGMPTKTTVPTMITVSPGFGLAESAGCATPLGNTIVLPSTLLFTPSAQGQTFSLDAASLNRLMVSTNLNELSPAASAVTKTAVNSNANVSSSLLSKTSNEAFNSLNTLASAAVAMAANTNTPSLQTHWSTASPRTNTKTTNSQQTGDTDRGIPDTSSVTQHHSLFHSLATPTGLTVFPLQMPAGGSTLLLAAANAKQQQQQLLASMGLATAPAASTASSKQSMSPTDCMVSGVSTATTLQLLNSFAFSSPPPSSSAYVATTTLNRSSGNAVSSTTPCTKPKFKALRESPSVDAVQLILNHQHDGGTSGHCLSSTSSTSSISTACSSPQTDTTFSSVIITSTGTVTPSKRQSPLLKCISQTPKRLASAASYNQPSTDSSNLCSETGKKLLLVCSKSITGQPPSATTTGNTLLLSPTPDLSMRSSTNGGTSLDTSSTIAADSIFPKVLQTSLTEGGERLLSTSCTSPSRALPTSSSATVLVATVPSTVPFLAYQQQQQQVHQPMDTAVMTNNSLLADEALFSPGTPLATATPSALTMSRSGDPTVISNKFFENGGRRNVKEDAEFGDDEARRRAKRRERNRVAAAKCRQRRQDQIEELQARVDQLKKAGQEIHATLMPLKTERDRLEQMIRQHGLAGCATALDLISSLKDCVPEASTCVGHTAGGSSVSAMANGLLSSSTDSGIVLSMDLHNFPLSTCATSRDAGLVKPDPCASPSEAQAAKRQSLATIDVTTATQLAQLSALQSFSQSTAEALSSGNSLSLLVTTSSSNNESGIVDKRGDLSAMVSPGNNAASVATAGDTGGMTRVVTATRPSTLIPTATLFSTMTKETRTAAEANPTKTSLGGITGNNNSLITPCFWPSELQGFSPILTPSAWKLLKNLTIPQSTSVATPTASILLTPAVAAAALQAVAATVSTGTADAVPTASPMEVDEESATTTIATETMSSTSTSTTTLASVSSTEATPSTNAPSGGGGATDFSTAGVAIASGSSSNNGSFVTHALHSC